MIVNPIANVFVYCRVVEFVGGFDSAVIDSVRLQTPQTLAWVSKCLSSFALFIKDSSLPWTPSESHYQESCHINVIEQPWVSVWMCVMGHWRHPWGQRSCHTRPWNAFSHNLTGDMRCMGLKVCRMPQCCIYLTLLLLTLLLFVI